MAVRIGTNPIAWSNDDLCSLGGKTPLAICLAEARRAGFVGIELGHKFPRTPDALAEVLTAHDLALVSGWYSSRLLERPVSAEIAAIDAHASLLTALGCEVLILAETSNAIHGRRDVPLSRSPTLDPAGMRGLARAVTEVARHLADRGLQLAYHHHLGTVVESMREIEAFMTAAGDEVGLLLDSGHALAAGIDPVDLARTYGARIVHLHCKDLRPAVLERLRREELSFLDAVVAGLFTVPGDGALDFPALLAALAGAGYAGWLVVEAEQDPAKADPFAYACLGYSTLANAARQVGMIEAGDG